MTVRRSKRLEGGFSTGRLLLEVLANANAHWVSSGVRVGGIFMAGLLLFLGVYENGLLIQEEARRQQLAGYSAWIAAGVANQAVIPAGRCDALAVVPGVDAAGALLESSTVRFEIRPGARYEADAVTPGMISFLWPGVAVPGVEGLVVGSDVAAELGLLVGSSVRLQGYLGVSSPGPGNTTQRVASVMSPSPRDESADRKIFIVNAAVGDVAQCYISSAPGAESAIGALIPGWFTGQTGAVAVPYVPASVRSADPQVLYDERSSRWFWLATAVAVVLLHCSFVITRRAEYSLYSILGAGKRQVLLVLVAETGIFVILPLVAAWTVGLLTIPTRAGQLPLVLGSLDMARALLVCITAPVFSLMIVQPWRAVDVLKEG